jgi:hypothetical protein
VNLGFAVKVFHDGERQCCDDWTEEQQQQTCPVVSFAGRSRNLGKRRLACASGPAAPPGGSSCPSESACCGRKLRHPRHIRRRQPLGVFASAGWTGIPDLSIGGPWKRGCEFRAPCPCSLKGPNVNFSTTHCEGHVTTEPACLANRKGRNNRIQRLGIQQLSKAWLRCNFCLAFEPKIVLSVAHKSW